MSYLYKNNVIFICIMILIGLNLRPIMASIGPIVPVLQQSLSMSSIQISLLTTLPIAMMGLFNLCGPIIQKNIGEYNGILYGLLILYAANTFRFVINQSSFLIISAVFGGIGIAFIQALMPSFIKKNFPLKAEFLLGLFSTSIMGGAAITAAMASPLTEKFSYTHYFGLISIFTLLAIIVWKLYKVPKNIKSNTVNCHIHKTKSHWLLLLFFGLSTGAYTLVLAWLPPYYIQLGWSAEQAGYALALLTSVEVIAGISISFLITYTKNYFAIVLNILIALLLGLLSLTMIPNTLPLLTIVLLGLSIGSLFPLSLIITFNHIKSINESSSLLSFVQGGGYLIAAIFPLIAGLIRDAVTSLSAAWIFMMIIVGILLIIGSKITSKNV